MAVRVNSTDADMAAHILAGHVSLPVDGGASIVVVKTGDTARTSNVNLFDDPDLKINMQASQGFIFDLFLVYDAANTGDIKFAFTVPSGATLLWGLDGAAVNTSVPTNTSVNRSAANASGTALSCGANNVGSKMWARARGYVLNGSTVGYLQLQLAQVVSDVSASTLYANSFLKCERFV